MKIKVNKNIENGIDWLVNSGIQSIDNSEKHGGFAAWYDLDTKKYAFTYSEITGYALNLLISFNNQAKTPNEKIAHSIKLATDYLINKAFEEDFGAVKCRYTKDKGWLEHYCTFDNGIVANALTNKYRMDGDRQALKVAKTILETLMDKLFYGEGFYARYIAAERHYQNEKGKWSTCFGSFHAKMAIPFLNMYDLTEDKKYLSIVENVLKSVTQFQKSSGLFVTCSSSNSTFLHPQCYTLEGFIAASLYLSDARYSDLVENVISCIDNLQMSNGGIKGFVKGKDFIKLDSPDINSQFLRCILISDNKLKNSKSSINLINRILSHQINDTDDYRTNGGFLMGDIWFYNQTKLKMESRKNHVNTWATIFALNALYYLQYEDKNPFTLC